MHTRKPFITTTPRAQKAIASRKSIIATELITVPYANNVPNWMHQDVNRPLNIMIRAKPLIVPPSNKQISVLLAEDHTSFRKSLRTLVELDGDIKVVGEAKNGNLAVTLNARLHPDVILMDIAMPLFNGLQATRQIMDSIHATKVLVLSSHADPEYVRQAVLLGASGYLIKQASAPVVANAIREAMKGNSYFSASISKQLREECQRSFKKRQDG